MPEALAPSPAVAPPSPKPAAPSPNPPPTKPAAPGPSPAAKPTAKSEFDMEMEKLDAALSPKPREDVEVPAKPSVEEGENAEDDDELEAAKDDAPKADAKPKSDRTIETPKSRRHQLEIALAEAKAAKEAIAEREARIAELDGRSQETTTLAQRLAAVEKERDEALAVARGLKQESSPEFIEKYQSPIDRAAEEAASNFRDLTINEPDGTTRKADWATDFAKSIYTLSPVNAFRKAREMFGDDAQFVIEIYSSLKRLTADRNAAAEKERTNWQKSETEREANIVKQREATNAAYHHVEKTLRDQKPEWFVDSPEDEEGNNAVKSMAAFFHKPPRSVQEHVTLQARIKLQAENFPRVVLRLNKANARIAELEAKIASANDSEPGKVRRNGTQQAAAPKSFMEEMEHSLRGL